MSYYCAVPRTPPLYTPSMVKHRIRAREDSLGNLKKNEYPTNEYGQRIALTAEFATSRHARTHTTGCFYHAPNTLRPYV